MKAGTTAKHFITSNKKIKKFKNIEELKFIKSLTTSPQSHRINASNTDMVFRKSFKKDQDVFKNEFEVVGKPDIIINKQGIQDGEYINKTLCDIDIPELALVTRSSPRHRPL